MQLLTLCQRITDLEDTTRIRQTYDITWPSLIDGALALCHKLRRTGETHRLALTYMEVGLITTELSAAHLTEGDTRTVVGVDISRYLKDKTSEFLLFRLYVALLSLGRTRTGCYLHKTVEQFLYTKVIQCRAEEYRCHIGRAIGLHIKFGIDAIDQFKILAQLGGILLAHASIEFVAIDIDLYLIRNTLFVWREEIEFLFVDIIDALEFGTLVDGFPVPVPVRRASQRGHDPHGPSY